MIYSIHSVNLDFIKFLIEKVQPTDKLYEQCLEEAIKSHHNEITDYIQSNLIKDNSNISNNIFAYSFHYYNYHFFPNDFNNHFIFYYLCEYDYFTLAENFLKEKSIDIYNSNYF